MALFNNIRPGYFDHARLVEDLADTAGAISGARQARKVLKAPMVFLHRLGKDMLNATDEDFGALRLRRDTNATKKLSQLSFGKTFNGALEFTWLMAAAILARDDLLERFQHAGRLSFEKGLQWLVLHGITEHRLWHLISPQFITALTQHEVPGTCLTPLQLMLIREIPSLAKEMSNDRERDAIFFRRWLLDHGSLRFGLFWCLPIQDSTRLRRCRIKASLTQLVTCSSRERVKHFLRDTQSLAQSLIRKAPKPITVPLAQDAQHRIELMRKLDPDIGSLGHPLCFWAGMAGELAVIEGRYGVPSQQGILVSSSTITLVVPKPKADHHPHTIVLEAVIQSAENASDILYCRVNGQRSPVLRLSGRPTSLWLIDVAPNQRFTYPSAQIATIPIESIVNSVDLDGHIVSLELPRVGDAASPAGRQKLVVSRIWTF